MRHLFRDLLLHSDVADPSALLDEFALAMGEDFIAEKEPTDRPDQRRQTIRAKFDSLSRLVICFGAAITPG